MKWIGIILVPFVVFGCWWAVAMVLQFRWISFTDAADQFETMWGMYTWCAVFFVMLACETFTNFAQGKIGKAVGSLVLVGGLVFLECVGAVASLKAHHMVSIEEAMGMETKK